MLSPELQQLPPARTALVVGANGFVGGFVVSALRRRGWRVLRGVRPNLRLIEDERACELTVMTTSEAWREALEGVDAVVNVAGILRERGAQRFETLHVDAPLALARACVSGAVDCFVQISALGVPADGAFIASKHRFDELLQELPLRAVVLRPSVIYSVGGSYGGTSLLRALAAFPGRLLLPGAGRWPLQPVSAEDVGELVARAVEGQARGVFEVGAPTPMSLDEYQRAWRRWLRLGGNKALCVPEPLVSAQVWLWERLGTGPVGATMWRMLRRGNVTRPEAADQLRETFAFAPRTLDEVLHSQSSQVQDRWHAQLYFLVPMLKLGVVALWLLSGVSGLLASAPAIGAVVGDSALADFAPVALARASAVLDIVLGLWLASARRPRVAIALMACCVVAYTLLLGSLVPALWLDALGGMAKNLVVLPALAVLWVLVERR